MKRFEFRCCVESGERGGSHLNMECDDAKRVVGEGGREDGWAGVVKMGGKVRVCEKG